MDEKNVAVEKAVETETTQTNSPQVESPITGDETIQGEQVSKTPVVEESDVPGDIEEQRRAFQEMRLENKRLKEQMEAKPAQESAFDALRPQVAPTQSFNDPVSGETDWTQYNQSIIAQAKAEARAEVQETLDEQNARAKYPELMNDPKTEKLIAAQWFMESKFAGKPVSITQVAEEFARNFKQATSKAEKIGAEKILNEVSEKEKAGLQATSQSSQGAVRATSMEDAARLSVGTRSGDADAITARISKIPWANK